MDAERLKREMRERVGEDERWREALEYVEELERTLSGERRRIRRMRLDFETVIEVVSQINARSLDTELIENFTLSTLMGQFAVQRAFIMRQEARFSDRIAPTASKNVDVPDFTFKPDGPFAAALLAQERPFRVEDVGGSVGAFEEFERIRRTGMELCVPLVKRHEDGALELKGVICLDKKFGRMAFDERDMEFLSLLASMVAISLHNAQLYRRSIFDEMTQVFSRGHFDAHLFQEIERAKRYHSGEETSPYEVSLVMFDIDDFKLFNDRYGHQTGDRILKGVARVVKKGVRTSDVVARYGGEEFCIVLPETGKENAVRAAERIRGMIETFSLNVEGRRLTVTVSMGVATYPDDAGNVQELVREADKALYRAKARGKNQVVEAGRDRPADDSKESSGGSGRGGTDGEGGGNEG